MLKIYLQLQQSLEFMSNMFTFIILAGLFEHGKNYLDFTDTLICIISELDSVRLNLFFPVQKSLCIKQKEWSVLSLVAQCLKVYTDS